MTATRSRAWRVAAAAALAALVLAPAGPAAGALVFAKDGEVWAANPDGSGAHPEVRLTDVPGTITLANPFASADGRVVVFDARWAGAPAEQARSGAPGASGVNSDGVYRFTGGVATRLSQPPASCPLAPCYTGATEPELDAAGAVHAGWALMSWQACWPMLWCPAVASGGVVTWQPGASASVNLPTACTDVGVMSPTANPAAAGEVAYTGCASGGNPTVWATNGAAQRTIASDDVTQRDPSFSPAGVLVVAEDGTEPGLWTYPPGQSRYVLAQPAGTSFSSPRFVDGDRIAFVANGDLWSVPAGCTLCAFPGQATRLTSLGGVSGLSFTPAAALALRPAPAPPAPSAPVAPPAPTAQPAGPVAPLGPVVTFAGAVRVVSPRAVRVLLRCPVGRGRCTGRAVLVARVAGRSVGIGAARFGVAAGRSAAVTVTLTARGVALLRSRGRLAASLRVTATAANRTTTVTRAVILRRPS